MPIRVHPSPVTYQHGRSSTKTGMMPHPPDGYGSSSTFRRRIAPRATHHAIDTSSYSSKPGSLYSTGYTSPLSTTSRDAYRPHRPELTRRTTTGPITAKYEPKSYDTASKYTSRHAPRDVLPEQRSSGITSLTKDMLRLPYVDESPTRTYKSSNFGSVTDNLYKSSMEDLEAPRPRDSSESRVSSANGGDELKDSYSRTDRSTSRPVNRQSSYSTLKRTPSIVKLNTRRSSLSDYSSRSTAGEYGLGTVKGAGKRGLKNIGNTCYMNTIVQCLSSIPDLSTYCLQMDYLMHKDVNCNSYHSGKLFQEFAETLKKLWNSESTTSHYTPFNLKRQIGNMLSHEFRGYRQHDAAEFLLGLLAELSEDVNRVKDPPRLGAMPENLNPADLANLMWRRQQQLCQSIIFEIFNGLTRSTLRCSTCDYVSVTFELFYDLSVPIPTGSSRPSLADALELYTKPETLSGENKFRCEKCKTLRAGTKKMEIERCPKVLIIQLKRFSSSHSGLTRKMDTYVDFPLHGLDLCNNMSENAVMPSRYQLQAVCNHYGGTAGGHYIAYCRHQEDNQWYKYDDERVTQLKECNVVTSNAYVLFYTAKSPKLSRSDSRL